MARVRVGVGVRVTWTPPPLEASGAGLWVAFQKVGDMGDSGRLEGLVR